MKLRWLFVVVGVSALIVGLIAVAAQSVALLSLALVSFLAVAFAIALVSFSRTAGYGNLSRMLIRVKP